eukprot:763448-Hanusia_phi.AAC.3
MLADDELALEPLVLWESNGDEKAAENEQEITEATPESGAQAEYQHAFVQKAKALLDLYKKAKNWANEITKWLGDRLDVFPSISQHFPHADCLVTKGGVLALSESAREDVIDAINRYTRKGIYQRERKAISSSKDVMRMCKGTGKTTKQVELYDPSND